MKTIARMISFILSVLLIFNALPVYSETINADKSMIYLVKKGEKAYLEPIDENEYFAGIFKYTSVVNIIEEYNSNDTYWKEISYNTVTDNNEPEKRSLFVKKDSLYTVPYTCYSDDCANELISENQFDSMFSKFEESLLVDHEYNPNANNSDTLYITFTDRIESNNDESKIKDALVYKTSQNNDTRSSVLFTPLVRFTELGDTNIQYPIDNKSMSYLSSEDKHPQYYIYSDSDYDYKIEEGLKFILLNAPPYKTYTHYPADYENASRVAASLAIRAFMRDFTNNNDDIDIFNGLSIKNLNQFNSNYLAYMEYLYYGAVNAYENAKSEEQIYLSVDVSKEPYLSGNNYIAEVRITTNNRNGWYINKSTLPEGLIIEGADETEGEYTGIPGSTLLRLIADTKLMGETINVNVCYKNDDPVLQFAMPFDSALPSLVSLTKQSSAAPAKKISVKIPDSARITIKVIDAATNEPLEKVKVKFVSDSFVKTEVTDQNGHIKIDSVPGTVNYECISAPGYETAQKAGSISLLEGEETSVSLTLDKLKYNLTINVNDSFYNTPIQDDTPISIINTDKNESEKITSLTEDGKVVFNELEGGNYKVLFDSNKTYESLKETYTVNLYDKSDEEINIECNRYNGTIKIGCKDEEDNYIEGVKLTINKNNKVLSEITTSGKEPIVQDIPEGKYTLKIESTPDGYEDQEYEKTIKIEHKKTEGIKIKFKPKYTSIELYPRLSTDYDKFTPKKKKIKDKSLILNGIKYALVANEDIFNKDGEQVAASGDTIGEFEPTSGKESSGSIKVIYPGKYIIRNTETVKGALLSEEIEVNVTLKENNIILPVLVNRDEEYEEETLNDNDKMDSAETPDETVEEEIEETVEIIENIDENIEDNNSNYNVNTIRVYVNEPVSVSTHKNNKSDNMLIDIKDLDYISSASMPVTLIDLKSKNCTTIKTSELGEAVFENIQADSSYMILIYDSARSFIPVLKAYTGDDIIVKLQIKPSRIQIKRRFNSNDKYTSAEYGLYVVRWAYGKVKEEDLKTPIKTQKDIFGTIVFDVALPEGEYFVSPVVNDKEYDPDSKTNIIISNPGETIDAVENKKYIYPVELAVYDSLSSVGMKNAYISVKNNEKETLQYTDENGKTIMMLSPDRYEMSVVLVPEYYALPKENLSIFTVDENGMIEGETEVKIDHNRTKIAVQDTDNNNLYGAVIDIVNKNTHQIFTSSTDTNGYAIFHNLPFGEYVIKERYPAAGYKINTHQTNYIVDGAFTECEEFDALFLDEKNQISVYVKNKNNDPVENSVIILKDSNNSIIQRSVTNSEGVAKLTNIPIGTYRLELENTTNKYIGLTEPISIVITKDGLKENNDMTFIVEKRTINIKLTDIEGNGIYGSEFTLINKANAEVQDRKSTNASGELVFTKFEKGEYIISETKASKNTSITEDIEINIDENWNSNNAINIITYPDYYQMNIVDNKGYPVSLAVFTITNTDTKETKTSISGKNGIVSFDKLKKGNYIIQNTKIGDEYELSDKTIEIHIDENYKISDQNYLYIVKKKNNK